MADSKKRGFDWVADSLKDFKRYFEIIYARMNDDVVDRDAVFDLALKGQSQADFALDILKHDPDKIVVYMFDGHITQITGLPPGFELSIWDDRKGELITQKEMKLIS